MDEFGNTFPAPNPHDKMASNVPNVATFAPIFHHSPSSARVHKSDRYPLVAPQRPNSDCSLDPVADPTPAPASFPLADPPGDPRSIHANVIKAQHRPKCTSLHIDSILTPMANVPHGKWLAKGAVGTRVGLPRGDWVRVGGARGPTSLPNPVYHLPHVGWCTAVRRHQRREADRRRRTARWVGIRCWLDGCVAPS